MVFTLNIELNNMENTWNMSYGFTLNIELNNMENTLNMSYGFILNIDRWYLP